MCRCFQTNITIGQLICTEKSFIIICASCWRHGNKSESIQKSGVDEEETQKSRLEESDILKDVIQQPKKSASNKQVGHDRLHNIADILSERELYEIESNLHQYQNNPLKYADKLFQVSVGYEKILHDYFKATMYVTWLYSRIQSQESLRTTMIA